MNFREERAREHKTNIVKTAAKLFSEKGYHAVTVDEIARELKYTRGGIYYYINKKQDILFLCHDLAMNMLLDSIQQIRSLDLTPPLMLKEAIRRHTFILVGELNLLTVVLGSDFLLEERYAEIIRKKRDDYEGQIREIIVDGINKGFFSPISEKMVSLLIMGAVNWISRWYCQKGPLSIGQIADFFADYLVAPLTAGVLPDKPVVECSLSEKDKSRRNQ